MKLSIVVPVHNEAENVASLHREIVDACKKVTESFEIIFIDDGSSDGTLEQLMSLSPVTIIVLRKNFGQTAGLDAGIKSATGDYIITMDGDGQNDPAEIPRLVQAITYQNKDVISGWRRNRKDTFFKKMTSLAAARMRKFLINDGIADSGCTLKIYKRECFENVDLYGEMHRFIPAVLKIKGFTIGEIEVNHRFRDHGKTHYNWTRGIRGMLDMVSVWFWQKFANRPLHLFGGFGLFLIGVSLGTGLIAGYQKIFQGVSLSDTAWTTVSLISFLAGIQVGIAGLMADMISKTYYATSCDRSYVIKEQIKK